jgi:hypothetical protein
MPGTFGCWRPFVVSWWNSRNTIFDQSRDLVEIAGTKVFRERVHRQLPLCQVNTVTREKPQFPSILARQFVSCATIPSWRMACAPRVVPVAKLAPSRCQLCNVSGRRITPNWSAFARAARATLASSVIASPWTVQCFTDASRPSKIYNLCPSGVTPCPSCNYTTGRSRLELSTQ